MLTNQQFEKAAALLKCTVAHIKTVYEVESAGSAYLADGRVKILFEGHRFWKNILKTGINPSKFAAKYPNVIYSIWDRKQYKGGTKEWDRMSQAITACKEMGIPAEVALDSASYGSFQIMGENSKECGYDTAQQMLTSYNTGGEEEQLNSFCKLLINRGLDSALRNGQWATFARGYNGTGYRENKYDIKLATVFKKNS